MFAPGNEHLASRSAEVGEYPELAAAQIEASNATPKSEWAAGGTSSMLIVLPAGSGGCAGERLESRKAKTGHLALLDLR